MNTVEQLARVIEETKTKLRKLEKDHRQLVVDNCVHDWRDASYVNGHNGNDEDAWRCKKCSYTRYSPPC